MSRDGIKVGLLGCNMYRTRDLLSGAERACPGVMRIAASFDTDPAKTKQAADTYGGVACASRDELLSQDVDVIVVSLPPFLHAQAFADVAAAGKDIYLEKPVCVDDQGLALLRKAQVSSNVRAYVGLSYRYVAPFRKVAEILRRPDAGRIVGVHHHWLHGPGGDALRQPNWRNRLDQSGGQLIHHCCHLLDWFCWIGGPLADVSARSYTHPKAILQHEEQELTAAFRYRSGGLACFNLSQHSHQHDQFGTVHAEGLGIRYAWGKSTYVHVYQSHRREPDEVYTWDADAKPAGETDRDALQMGEFIRAYRADQPMPCTLDDGIRAYELARAVRASAADGTTHPL